MVSHLTTRVASSLGTTGKYHFLFYIYHSIGVLERRPLQTSKGVQSLMARRRRRAIGLASREIRGRLLLNHRSAKIITGAPTLRKTCLSDSSRHPQYRLTRTHRRRDRSRRYSATTILTLVACTRSHKTRRDDQSRLTSTLKTLPLPMAPSLALSSKAGARRLEVGDQSRATCSRREPLEARERKRRRRNLAFPISSWMTMIAAIRVVTARVVASPSSGTSSRCRREPLRARPEVNDGLRLDGEMNNN